ncbi:hypothetical protein [Curtobacterium sp. Leaf261]|uniref:hypothetical protein n=1 Tax=Curtobacterium sp. Leaf261 TaxID=1736311 RepID=UPI000A814EED
MGATFDLLSTDPVAPVCSRAGCRETAHFRINWRNPRIHAADRVKVWAACDEHRGFLADYLRSRSFPVTVTDIHEDVDRLDDPSGSRLTYGRASDSVRVDTAPADGFRAEASRTDATRAEASRTDATRAEVQGHTDGAS